MDAPDAVVEPALQPIAASAALQQQNAESDLAEDHGIDDELSLVATQPRHDPRIRAWLGGLGEHVRVYEAAHKLSVDSDSIGTK